MTEPWAPSFLSRHPLAREALALAVPAHAAQRRAVDGAPFVVHPLEVACLLAGRDQPDEVIAAAVLHDSIEDTGVTQDELERRFGARVGGLVAALTDDPSIPSYAARKAALRSQVACAGREAALIFAADKVAKVRELRAQTGSDPPRYGPKSDDPHTAERREHYRASLEMLEEVLADHPLVRQLRFELEVYRCLSPHAAPEVEPCLDPA